MNSKSVALLAGPQQPSARFAADLFCARAHAAMLRSMACLRRLAAHVATPASAAWLPRAYTCAFSRRLAREVHSSAAVAARLRAHTTSDAAAAATTAAATTAAASTAALAADWSPPKGFHDLLPPSGGVSASSVSSASSSSAPLTPFVVRSLRDVCAQVSASFAYREIEPPLVEKASLFTRGLGSSSDVVSKEMFTLNAQAAAERERGAPSAAEGGTLVLRPEGTTGVARALLHAGLVHGGSQAALQRYHYSGAMFRRERPQANRYRQFQQFGCELVGGAATAGTGANASDSAAVEADVEIIAVAHEILVRLGLRPYVTLQLNSLGSTQCRQRYCEALKTFLIAHREQLSEESRNRLDEGHLLRILDSKSEADQRLLRSSSSGSGSGTTAASAAPVLADFLSPAARAHFQGVQDGLHSLGCSFELNPFLVRGLDYYSHTCFEFVLHGERIRERMKEIQQLSSGSSGSSGSSAASASSPPIPMPAQSTVLAGGRYDSLFVSLGASASVPAVGFAAGIERLARLEIMVAPPEQRRRNARRNASLHVGVILVQAPTPAGASKHAGKEGDAAPAAAAAAASAADSQDEQQQRRALLSSSCAALCTYIRRGCGPLSPSSGDAAGAAASSSSSASVSAAASAACIPPPFTVLRSFQPTMSKQFKWLSRPLVPSSLPAPAPAAGASSTAASADMQQQYEARNVQLVIILGDDELAHNQVQIKHLASGTQTTVPLALLSQTLYAASETAGILHHAAPLAPEHAPRTFEQLRSALCAPS